MSQLTVEELRQLMREQFPQSDAVLEKIGPRWARVRIPVGPQHLRPGGTVSGPTMMALADTATYLALLAEIGLLVLAVTTNYTVVERLAHIRNKQKSGTQPPTIQES